MWCRLLCPHLLVLEKYSLPEDDLLKIERLLGFFPCTVIHTNLIMRRMIVATCISRYQIPPVFLAPLLARHLGLAQQSLQFCTSTPLCKRKSNQRNKRDSNPDRGVSALRRTGLRHPVSMSKVALPQPVLDPSRRKIEVDKDHGLWGFFNAQRTLLSTPEEDSGHG